MRTPTLGNVMVSLTNSYTDYNFIHPFVKLRVTTKFNVMVSLTNPYTDYNFVHPFVKLRVTKYSMST